MSNPAGVGRIAVNSLEALPSLPIGRHQRQVLDAITELCREGRRPSDQDTAAYLGWSINCIGQRNELVQAGRVVKGGDKRAETDRRVSWWKPAPEQLEFTLAAAAP